jgi:glutaminase
MYALNTGFFAKGIGGGMMRVLPTIAIFSMYILLVMMVTYGPEVALGRFGVDAGE